jgi:6-phosphogluconate dehydrogenase
MHIGFVGLGKMGANMVLRLAIGAPDGSVAGGHRVVGYARDPSPELAGVEGVHVVDSMDRMIGALPDGPRIVWMMVPAGDPTEQVVTDLATRLRADDVLIDGGNSYFKDTVRRAKGAAARGIHFIDVGTSGGIWGRQEGYCMMVGGEKSAVATIVPVLDTLAPTDGWAHVGPSGAGHFVKMVHNGIEYGLMEAYGEGFELLHRSKFNLDLHQVAKVWNHGSVVRSWLLELAEKMLQAQPTLSDVLPYVEDSGEGRWTLQAGIDEGVSVPVIAAALFARFASRDPYNLSARFAAGLRNQFGGHEIRKAQVKQITPAGDVRPEPADSLSGG